MALEPGNLFERPSEWQRRPFEQELPGQQRPIELPRGEDALGHEPRPAAARE